MKKALYLLFTLLFIGLTSCEDYKDCNSPVETALGLGFFQNVGGEEQDSTLPSLSFYPIQTHDTTLQSTQAIYVPLDPHHDTTQFFIRPDSSLANGDTLFVSYTLNQKFVSAGCGFKNVFQLDTVKTTHHHIDSITIKDKEVDVNQITNVKIYY